MRRRFGRFSRKTGKKRSTQNCSRKFTAYIRNKPPVFLRTAFPVHRLYDRIIAALKRNVKIRKKTWIFAEAFKNIPVKMIRVNIQKADKKSSRNVTNFIKQERKGRRRFSSAVYAVIIYFRKRVTPRSKDIIIFTCTVCRQILTDKIYFNNSLQHKAFNFCRYLRCRAASKFTANERNCTE